MTTEELKILIIKTLGIQQLTLEQLHDRLTLDERVRTDKLGQPRLRAIMRGMVSSGVLGKFYPYQETGVTRFYVPSSRYSPQPLPTCGPGGTWSVVRHHDGDVLGERMTEAEARVCATALNEHDRKVRNREAISNTHEPDPWFCGYATALADLWRLHREGSLVRNVILSGGLTVKHLEEGGVDEFDLSAIREAVYGIKENP